jgi:hypothetical protein
MTSKKDTPSKKDTRAERLAAALRENLRKRKEQDKTPPVEKPQI